MGGTSEVDQVNSVVRGVRRLVELESRLEQGHSLDLSTLPIQDVPVAEVPQRVGATVVAGDATKTDALPKHDDLRNVCSQAISTLEQACQDGRLTCVLETIMKEEEH